ncbi:c-type cytochrome biogenesis protein CcmI [Falsihalocynthiibacter sp. SS001]|uniref:c-type cytochrome biogenesis protein CcmI n=1 Tax=Falsihalocynthiibacter sp. SS001 TaxID=3349698 RepID=UPI0036D2F1A6
MWFYLTIAVITGLCAVYVIQNLLQRDTPKDGDAPTSRDVAFYQRQLAEIDRDVAQGTLSADEAARTKVEVSRRLLEADKRAQEKVASKPAPKYATYGAAGALVVLLFVVGGALYADLGANAREDAPLAQRYANAKALYDNRRPQEELEHAAPDRTADVSEADNQLINELRTALESRPDDAVGFRLLAKQEANLGNFAAARRAQTRVVELAGPEKAETDDLILLARIMVYGANGEISPEAEALWNEVLRRDPHIAEARYYMGLMFAQTRRPDVTYELWAPLMEMDNINTPWMQDVRRNFGDIAYFAGQSFSAEQPQQAAAPMDGSTAGPTAEQVADAQAMTPEERQEMILGMVASLGEKLETGEASAAEWAQYIRANSVLGNDEVVRETYATAKERFADSERDSQLIYQSGVEAGLEERVTE